MLQECLYLLGLGHHHLAELVEVHGAGAVLVQLLQDPLQLLEGEKDYSDEKSGLSTF